MIYEDETFATFVNEEEPEEPGPEVEAEEEKPEESKDPDEGLDPDEEPSEKEG